MAGAKKKKASAMERGGGWREPDQLVKPVRLSNGGRYFTLSRPVNATLQKQHKSSKMYLKYQK